MEEISSEREALTTAKCHRKLFQSVVAFAFLCVVASAIIIVVIFCLFIEDCDGCRSFLVPLLGAAAFVLFTAGLTILLTIIFCKRGFRRPGRRNSPTPQVVISLIPTEDLEKTPAPILPFNRVPRHHPFVETSLAADLPDYFTVVQKIYEVYSPGDTEVCPDCLGGAQTPPPTYEQALEMTSALTASQDNFKLQGYDEDTRV